MGLDSTCSPLQRHPLIHFLHPLSALLPPSKMRCARISWPAARRIQWLQLSAPTWEKKVQVGSWFIATAF